MGLIRFFLAASVVFAHSPSGNPYIRGLAEAQLAVETFFVISGFYIAMIYNERYGHYQNAQVNFYKSRYLRLYPSFIICTLLMIVSLIVKGTPYQINGGYATFVVSWSEIKESFIHMSLLPRLYYALSNLTLFGYDIANFLNIKPGSGETSWTYIWSEHERFLRIMFMPQAWSIGLELAFYVIAPWIVRFPLKIVVPIALSSFVYKLLLYKYDLFFFPLVDAFFPAEIGVFSLGACAYHFYKRYRSFVDRLPWPIYAALLLSIFTVGYEYQSIDLLPQIKYYIVLFFFAVTVPFVFGASRNLKWDRFIGELSYPIYVGHTLIDYQMSGTGQYRGIYTLLATTLLAVFLVIFVEHPINAFRRRPLNNSRPTGVHDNER